MDYLDSFGEWLRQRRERLGLTRAELADCAACSVSGLRKIELDERRPSRQLAELLADCLGIPPEQQRTFIDAARGAARVSHLGRPEPDAADLLLIPGPHPSRAAPSVPPAGPTWNVPVPVTPLIGREVELSTLVQLVHDPNCRLLTLVGAGGMGKTRLAIEAAYYLRDRFPDGIFFAALATIGSPEFMVPAIAQAIRLNFAGPVDPRTQLLNYLRKKQVLLLLDNLEHLLDGVALVVEMLAQAPAVQLLVTSRERLGLQGEWVFAVEGLPVSVEGEERELEKVSAVRLFLQRAHQARVDFELSQDEYRDVDRICRLVEGMPLAIELAAAWVPVLSCREIAVEIERSIDFLATTMRDVPERQRSVNAVFDSSWQLLSADEQHVLRRLSVFRGGFTRHAAEVVAAASLPMLSGLTAKSFLRRSSTGRFTMHELVRQYVTTRLAEEPGEESAARDAHSTYFSDLLAGLERALRGRGQREALATMDAEIENIRSAWRRVVQRRELAAMGAAMRALWYFYDVRGWFHEGNANASWVATELEHNLAALESGDEAVIVLSAYAHAQRGWFCMRLGRFEEAQQLSQTSVETLRQYRAYVELVDALQSMGALDRLMGDYARSRDHYQEMLQYALQTDDPWNVTVAEGSIAMAALALGNHEEARERMGATVSSFRTLGDTRMLASALRFLGSASSGLGAYDEAQEYLRESLRLSRATGDRWIEAMALRELGCVAQERGAHAEAVSLFQESLALAREIGEHWTILQALGTLGTALLALRDNVAAYAAFAEQLVMAWELQTLPAVLAALVGLARWSRVQGSGEEIQQDILASSLFVLNHPAAAYKTKDDARQLCAELELLLPGEQVTEARTRAHNLSLEALVTGFLAADPF